MGLEDFTPIESADAGWNNKEASYEVSEVFKEAVKKASSWIKRTQKDEWKAKSQDMLLANFLVVLILEKKYDDLLDFLFTCLNAWYPSNFLLWIISLVYIDISHKIREVSLKPHIEFSYKSPRLVDFDDSELHPQIKERINFWVEDIISSVSVEYSSLMTFKLIELLDTQEEIVLAFMSQTFSFFLSEINVEITENKSLNITNFILAQIITTIKKLNLEEV